MGRSCKVRQAGVELPGLQEAHFADQRKSSVDQSQPLPSHEKNISDTRLKKNRDGFNPDSNASL